MKIAVVSDSHGSKKAIESIFNNYQFDVFVHLGDGVEDLGIYANLVNVYAVRGNCDIFSDYLVEQMLEFDGVKILITHGHKYGVKYALSPLACEAHRQGANVALFGQTHRVCDEYINGIHLINPGTLKSNKQFMMLTTNNGDVSVKIVDLKC